MAKKQKLIGLDIGSTSVRAIEVSRTGDDVAITGFGYAPIDDPTQRVQGITAAMTRGGLKTKRVITAISGRLLRVTYVPLPRMPDEQLKEAVMVEANKYIPFDVEDAVIACEPLVEEPPAEGEELPPEMTVRLVAVKRDVIEEHVSELADAGMYAIVVDHDCFALGNAFEFKEMQRPEGERENRVIGLIDVGASKTSINVMSGTNSYFTREVPGGGANLTEAVSRRFNIGAEEAEQLKRDPGDQAEAVMEALLGPLDDLMSEIGLSFDYFENQHDKVIEQVLVSGGTCKMGGILDVFQQNFDKPTELWNPLEGLNIQVPEHQKEQLEIHANTIAISVGLAARVVTLS